MEKKRVFGLVGPTASGKTAVSIALAQRIGGEIVCMDSMQIYRRMDIGTAKPTADEQRSARHHMIDLIEPTQEYSVTEYAEDAKRIMDQIDRPILVGGTGFFLRSLSLPMDFGFTPKDDIIRDKYQAIADQQGNMAVHDLLEKCDPVTAARLHPNDVRRVIRALEVFELTGKPFSEQKMPDYNDSPYLFSLFALDWQRDILYARIEQRVDQMIAGGLIEEVRSLLDSGVPETAQSMQGLGYKELIPVFKGEDTLQNAILLIKQKTRNYAKRQLTWFKADPRICWIKAEPQLTVQNYLDIILHHLEENHVSIG